MTDPPSTAAEPGPRVADRGAASGEEVALVDTAQGPVRADRLGRTLMHEHLFVTSPEVQLNWPDYPERWDEQGEVERAVRRLAELRATGFGTLVDLTVLGLGRYVPRVAEVARRSDVNIVVATGAYVLSELPLYFRHRGPGTPAGGPDRLADFFVRDVAEGITGTTIRAALLKCATGEAGLTPDVERVLRAVASAHRQTGVPISTHSHSGSRRGLDQQRVLAEEGVDLTRVVIGHCGDTEDYDYLERLIDAGSYLGMDQFGLETVPFETRVEIVATMCARGHAGRMVLSQDAPSFSDVSDPMRRAQLNPRWTWTHLADDVLPELLRRGVSQQDVDRMLVDNPREILSRRGAY